MYLTLCIYINTKGNNIGICKFKKFCLKYNSQLIFIQGDLYGNLYFWNAYNFDNENPYWANFFKGKPIV